MSPAAERKAASADLSLLGTPEPLPDAVVREHLETLREFLDEKSRKLLGYQLNQDIDYSALGPFLGFNSNNLGDPYIDGNYGVHSRTFERAVLEFVARLFHVDDRKYWGYVTSGGTEGTIYGIYVGRNYLESVGRGRADGPPPQPKAFFSKDTHYSINKTMDMLRLPSETIPSDPLGRVRVDALIEAIVRNDPVAHPPLIIANLGSTFTGAYDDVEEIVRRLSERGIEHYYLHVDAALGGFFLPFAEQLTGLGAKVPIFDFRLPIHSIAFSGHKIIGTPIICGVFMTLFDYLAYGNARQVEYIGSVDTTLAGSRSGLAPIALWYAIARMGTSGFVTLPRHNPINAITMGTIEERAWACGDLRPTARVGCEEVVALDRGRLLPPLRHAPHNKVAPGRTGRGPEDRPRRLRPERGRKERQDPRPPALPQVDRPLLVARGRGDLEGRAPHERAPRGAGRLPLSRGRRGR